VGGLVGRYLFIYNILFYFNYFLDAQFFVQFDYSKISSYD
jgi:hypothetical protein